MPPAESEKHFVRSLDRGLTVIRSFNADSAQMTLSEVAKVTGLTRAATRRILLTLLDLGYVRANGREFSLTPRILELGYSYLSSISLPEVAEPHLENLVAETRESSSIAVLDGNEIIYVARVPTTRIMTVAINVGTSFPAYATSMGRVLLAGLPAQCLDDYLRQLKPRALTQKTMTSKKALRQEIKKVTAQDWAVVDQELEDGLRSVAVPIRDGSGTVIAAMNSSTQAGRTPLEEIKTRLLPALQATAKSIERDLGAGVRGPAT